MTELEYIRTAPIEEIAKMLVETTQNGFIITTDGWFFDDTIYEYDVAIAHQIEILRSEHIEK